jgi:hypothetical protein
MMVNVVYIYMLAAEENVQGRRVLGYCNASFLF